MGSDGAVCCFHSQEHAENEALGLNAIQAPPADLGDMGRQHKRQRAEEQACSEPASLPQPQQGSGDRPDIGAADIAVVHAEAPSDPASAPQLHPASGDPSNPVAAELAADSVPSRSRKSGKQSPYSGEQLRFIGKFCVMQRPNAKGIRAISQLGVDAGMWTEDSPLASERKVRSACEAWCK